MQPVQTVENIHDSEQGIKAENMQAVPNDGKQVKTMSSAEKKKTPLVLNAGNHVTDERGTKRGKHVERWRAGERSVSEVMVGFVSHCHKSSTAL